MLTPCNSEDEAHYLCACLPCSIVLFTVKSYAIETSVSTHVFNYVAIPKFESTNSSHTELSALSKEAHRASAAGEHSKLKEIEESIDQASARLWELTPEELRDIQNSLRDLRE